MKKRIIAATGLIGLGILCSGCDAPRDDIPAHIERIEYLEDNLDAKMIDVDSEFFGDVIFSYDDGRGYVEDVSPETRRGTLYTMLQRSNGKKPLDYYLLSVRDTELFGHDGDVDQVVLIRYNAKTEEEWNCKLWRYEITDDELVETLDEHYELSTEAAYLALTEGKESYRTIVGKAEWKQLAELCGH